jgi:FKBP-type peptidyl-prolyl cis-trans isomerase SlyD
MEKVEKHKVVTMTFTLLNESGEVLEETGETPISFIFGIGQLIEGLEKGIEGMKVGEEREIIVTPEEGYGVYDPDAVEEVPVELFGDIVPEPGMRFYAQTEDGRSIPIYVKEVKDDTVIIDYNHPLAGETLLFRVKVLGIRDATPEEISEGHIHPTE